MIEQQISLLATNPTYTLFSSSKQVFLVNSVTTELINRKQFEANIGSLQYATGIVAVCNSSQILIYDMLYDKQLYTFNLYEVVLKMHLMKNILVLIYNQRIVIHDVDKKQNLCYLSIFSGEHAFINPDYYQMKFFYPQNQQKIINRSLWNNTLQVYRGIKYSYGCYLDQGNSICLAYDKIISIYHKQKLVHLCVLENNVSMIRVFKNDLFVLAKMYFKVIRKQGQTQLQVQTQNKKILLDFKDHFQDKLNELPANSNSEIWFTKTHIFKRENKEVQYLSFDDIKLQNASSISSQSQINLKEIQIMSRVSEEQLPIQSCFQQGHQPKIFEQSSSQKQQQQNLEKKEQINKVDELLSFWVQKTNIKQEQTLQASSEQHLKNRLSVSMEQQS